jgi:hypothetical protein
MTYATGTNTGTYTISGNTVTLTYIDSEGNTNTVFTGTISGNTITPDYGWPTFTKQ